MLPRDDMRAKRFDSRLLHEFLRTKRSRKARHWFEASAIFEQIARDLALRDATKLLGLTKRTDKT